MRIFYNSKTQIYPLLIAVPKADMSHKIPTGYRLSHGWIDLTETDANHD